MTPLERIRAACKMASEERTHFTCPDDWADCNDARHDAFFLSSALLRACEELEKLDAEWALADVAAILEGKK